MVVGHLLIGVLTAVFAAATSLLVMGPSWSTFGFYVLGGDLGLLVSASVSWMSRIFRPADR